MKYDNKISYKNESGIDGNVLMIAYYRYERVYWLFICWIVRVLLTMLRVIKQIYVLQLLIHVLKPTMSI